VSKRGGRRGWRLRAWFAALAVALSGVGASASAAQALPPGFWGVVPQSILSLEQFQRLQRGGVQSVRVPIVWSAVQPSGGGSFDWSAVDVQIEAASRAGLSVFPFLSGAPSWAVPSVWVPGSGHSVKAPAHLPVSGAGRAGWISFITAAVARYGPSGSFWAEHATVPRRPLRTWQIWNEENFKYFVARPDPAEYGKLVKISYAALKSADPASRVVLGGMFAKPGEATRSFNPPRAYFAADFLEQMYQRTPGIKAKFNGVALHPYTPRYQELTPDIEEFRSVLAANHDAGKGLWITELGWSSKGKTAANSNGYAKGAAGQAAQLNGAFSLLQSRQRKWKVQGVYWFSVDDYAGACNFCDGSGLFAAGFKPKKSWFSYAKFAGGTP
jgi:Glycosyl hydrolase catalytic core